MEVFLSTRNGNVKAKAIYDEKNKTVTVCKGSIISNSVAGGSFRSANSVIKLRNNKQIVNGVKVVSDVEFKSASSAANFVTGSSTNGLKAWKNKDGVPLNKLIER